MTLPLFETEKREGRAPLAERMRPRTLSEYVGQSHLLAPGRLLRRAIEADRVSSLILYGPPGTGKTTLARVIAEHSKATFISLNAVLSGVKALREEVEAAQRRQERFGQSTLLFIDEIHRFNQAQQDALLPWVERGVVTLIGATTENPYFEVNAALNSRSHIFQLKALTDQELKQVVFQALGDTRGYAGISIDLESDALSHWVSLVNGDARSLLNALELAVETTPVNSDGRIRITLEVAEASIQERAVLYDRDGDAHFDTLSAYIKSMRGSDPDAALYWLAKMLYAGEPPRGIFRRLLIFACEDVGLAWAQGISVVEACASAFDRVGMPEGRFHLSHATLAMATAPKSNSTMGLFDAISSVQRAPQGGVPLHLRDGSRDGEALGHGVGYLYPHAYQNHWVAQEHLPEVLRGQVFYTPTDQGEEKSIGTRIRALREAQVEGTLGGGAQDPLVDSIEAVSPHEKSISQWVERAMGDVSLELSRLRDSMLEAAELKRGDVVLDLNAGSGLLTWPSVRACQEGGVYSWCLQREEGETLNALAQSLPWPHRPVIGWGAIEEVQKNGVRFNKIFGRNLFDRSVEMGEQLQRVLRLLTQDGVFIAADPSHEEALHLSYQLETHFSPEREAPEIDRELWENWRKIERNVYAEVSRSLTEPMMLQVFHDECSTYASKLHSLNLSTLKNTRSLRLTHQRISQWLGDYETSYLSRLRQAGLNEGDALKIKQLMSSLAGHRVSWVSAWRLLRIELSAH